MNVWLELRATVTNAVDLGSLGVFGCLLFLLMFSVLQLMVGFGAGGLWVFGDLFLAVDLGRLGVSGHGCLLVVLFVAEVWRISWVFAFLW